MSSNNFDSLVTQIRASATSGLASPFAKAEAITLVGVLSLAFESETFDQKSYKYYMGYIDEWLKTFSGRTYVFGLSRAEVLQDHKFKNNAKLADLIVAIIPAFDHSLFERFGFVPKKTFCEKEAERHPVSMHHGRSKTRPLTLQEFQMTKFRSSPENQTRSLSFFHAMKN
jgi:hypothetical protein